MSPTLRFGTMLKFGRNGDISIANAEDIWDGGGVHVFPTAARIHAIVSTDARDDPVASPEDPDGAHTVEINGLDANYDDLSETVTLSGVTPVNTVGSYLRIHRMIVKSSGSNTTNVGTITATAATDSTVTAQITIGYNQTLMAVYTIPAGQKALLGACYASVNKATAGAAEMTLRVRPFGETWQTKHIWAANSTGATYAYHPFIYPPKLGEKSDIKLHASAGSNNMDISGGFDLELSPK